MTSNSMESHQHVEAMKDSVQQHHVVAFNDSLGGAPNFSACVAMNASCNRTMIRHPFNGTSIPHHNSSLFGDDGDSDGTQTNMAILISLIVLIVVLLLILSYLVGPPIVWFVKRRIPVDPKKVDARYETIEGWLISKKVRAHDDACPCAQIQGRDSAAVPPSPLPIPDLKHSSTYDTVETIMLESQSELDSVTSRDAECPICMSPMKDGDIVSYNFSGSCTTHVFHHSCIKEWLLRHATCPSCRQTYLPIDDLTSSSSSSSATSAKEGTSTSQPFTKLKHKQLTKERIEWCSRTFVCERSGLVIVDSPVPTADVESTSEAVGSATATSSTMEWVRISCPAVKRTELMELRGNKSEEGKTISADEDERGAGQPVNVDVPFAH